MDGKSEMIPVEGERVSSGAWVMTVGGVTGLLCWEPQTILLLHTNCKDQAFRVPCSGQVLSGWVLANSFATKSYACASIAFLARDHLHVCGLYKSFNDLNDYRSWCSVPLGSPHLTFSLLSVFNDHPHACSFIHPTLPSPSQHHTLLSCSA